MEERTYKVFKFKELTEKQQEKVLDRYYNINVEHEWWESTYEDAENIGLKITEFDIDRGSYCKGKFLASAEETAHKIEKEHGDTCATFTTAKAYLKQRDKIVAEAQRDPETGELVDEYLLDIELDKCDAEFLRELCEDYLTILRDDYEYLTSKEAVIETLEANDYDFTEEGKID